MEFTRQQHMAGQCCHYTYYTQFVDNTVRMAVERFIGIDRILRSTDKAFNDIPLSAWDGIGRLLAPHVGPKLRSHGDTVSLGGLVCVVKMAARIIRAEHEVAI